MSVRSGVWIRGVSAIQGSRLEGCPQFRGLDCTGVCSFGDLDFRESHAL